MTVSLHGVSKSYGNVGVLNDIDLAVAPGDYLAIVGPSGSGKSTLLNILGLLDRPDTGRYQLDGVDAAELSDARRADLRATTIGFVFQHAHLLPGRSAQANVELGLAYDPEGSDSNDFASIAQDALVSVGLEDRTDHLPSQLSGGEAQRVAVARAIVKQPSLLLCDEPTGNLDQDTTNDLMQLLEHLDGDVTLVVVTHDPSVSQRAAREVTLTHGRLEILR